MSEYFKYSLIGRQIVILENIIAHSALNSYKNILILFRNLCRSITQIYKKHCIDNSNRIKLIIILLAIAIKLLNYIYRKIFKIPNDIRWEFKAFFPKESINQDKLMVFHLCNSKLSLDNINRYESFVMQNAITRKKLGYSAENFNSPFFKIFHNIILNSKSKE